MGVKEFVAGVKDLLKKSAYKNPDGLSKDHIAAIAQHLGRLEPLDANVAARAVRHVVDGGDESVLLALGGVPDAGKVMAIGPGYNFVDFLAIANERARVFQPDGKVKPGFWVRLAQVLDACRQPAPPVLPGWPTWLALLVEQIVFLCHAHLGGKKLEPWPLADLLAVMEHESLPADLLARALLDPSAVQGLQQQWSYFLLSQTFIPAFTGWDRYLAGSVPAVRDALARPEAERRLTALRSLNAAGFDFTPVIDLLVDFGTGSAKTVRDEVLSLLRPVRDAARPLVEKYLAEGDATRRHEAAQLLWRLFERGAETRLREHAAAEKSGRVKQTIEKLLAAPDEAAAAGTSNDPGASPPAAEVETGEVPLGEEAKRGLKEAFQRAHRGALEHYDKQVEQWQSSNRPKWMQKPEKPDPPSEKHFDGLFRFLEGKDPEPPWQGLQRLVHWRGPLGDWLAPPGVRLIHVVRLGYALGQIVIQKHGGDAFLWWHATHDLDAYRGRCPTSFGLAEVDAAVAALPGSRPGLVGEHYLRANGRWSTFLDWEPAAVWPFFARNTDLLRDLLRPAGRGRARSGGDFWWPERRRAAFKVLTKFPRLPGEFIAPLWDLALGEAKADWELAQAALATVPDKAERILVSLKDGRQSARAAAAEWLGRVGEKTAVVPLKDAVRKEKVEAVKGVMLAALEALGADVDEFLNRDALPEEAAAGLARKRPAGMEWVPLDSLPPLHWKDSGKPVDPRVVQWWVLQSIQHKSPVPGPLLRRYLKACRKDESAALARFLLSAWIGHDTLTRPAEEVAAEARRNADAQWAQLSVHQYYRDHYKGDKENLYREIYQHLANACVGSAVGEKGLLALVAAGGGGDCVKMCEQYIQRWYGYRLSQSKALVEVLAWIDHPLAIQVLLSLANRFRTKAVRKLAAELVQALADREGWTLDELADRTVPDAGFERPVDDAGVPVGDEAKLVLDYGPRQFTVKLGDDLQPVITTGEGKPVKNPPAAGKQDDPEKAKAARKAFTEAKKVVKEVVKRQTERLYEALCTQRTWRFDDWRRYLSGHPIVGKLCVRAAWAAFAPDGDGERFLGCFRPLEDGSLTNENDESVTFDPETRLRLAHACNTPAEQAAAWLGHFSDYDVEPLFPQFGRATYALPPEKEKETDLTDFEGHGISTFRLRGKATKLGYVRGEAEDGGSFSVYRKSFTSLGLQAVLEFTGSFLPEQDIPAALTVLYFIPLKGDREVAYSWSPNKLPLGKVPSVLLSECYNDVKQIAAEGTGFDPKWKEKSYF